MQADIDNSGTIDYEEFVAATLHMNKVDTEDHLFAAFSYFDKDGSGYITLDELQEACKEFGVDDVHLEEIIKEADENNVCFQPIYLCMGRFRLSFISNGSNKLNSSNRLKVTKNVFFLPKTFIIVFTF